MMLPTQTLTQTLTLSDGRDVEYICHGTLSGQVIVYFHGAPGSCQEFPYFDDISRLSNRGVIALNRPGTGKSTFCEKWDAISFSANLNELLETLNVKHVTLMGFSAGGLYACAFARYYPKKVVRLLLLASVIPNDDPTVFQKSAHIIQCFYTMAVNDHKILEKQLVNITTPEALLDLVVATLSPVDSAFFNESESRSKLLMHYSDTIHQGISPLVREIVNVASPWGFALDDIEAEIKIWCGTSDYNVPIGSGEYLVEHIPLAQMVCLDGAGHYFLFQGRQKIMADILGDLD